MRWAGRRWAGRKRWAAVEKKKEKRKRAMGELG
jgi:hypothetical protein